MKSNKLKHLANQFSQIYKGENIINMLNSLPDEVLLRDMYQSADLENYELAILYRNELIKRGVLQPAW